jgi:hypothetical protein
MILVTGSSWGAGEWHGTDVMHAGISQLLNEDGKLSVNLSQSATTARTFLNVLEKFINYNRWSFKFEKIVVFENNYFSYYADLLDNDPAKADDFTKKLKLGINYFVGTVATDFYLRLSALAQQYDIPIVLVGSMCDVISIDNWTTRFPMLTVGCQSTVNLVTANQACVTHPIHTINVTNVNIDTVEHVKKHLSVKENEKFLDHIDQGHERLRLFKENHSGYFCEDGWHLNRKGYHILYQHLKTNGHL